MKKYSALLALMAIVVAIGGCQSLKVSIPTGYPSTIIPIMDGAKLEMAARDLNERKETTYSLTATIEQSREDVVAYYSPVHKTAQSSASTESDEKLTLYGIKEGWDYVIVLTTRSTGKEEVVVIEINVAPQGSIALVAELVGTATSQYDDTGPLPGGYPDSTIPLYEGAVIQSASRGSISEKVAFAVMLSSDKPVADIAAYYNSLLKDSADYREESLGKGTIPAEGQNQTIGEVYAHYRRDLEEFTFPESWDKTSGFSLSGAKGGYGFQVDIVTCSSQGGKVSVIVILINAK